MPHQSSDANASIARAYRLIRLYVPDALVEGAEISLDASKSHYLVQVMRLKAGDSLLVFNGTDGEWGATLANAHRKAAQIQVQSKRREQTSCPPIQLCMAPLKHGPMDFLVEKATELGVAAFQPIRTERMVVSRINEDRMRAKMIEAAEQCERLDIPDWQPLKPLSALFPRDEVTTLFADESGSGAPIGELFGELLPRGGAVSKLALLVGPEGGFTEKERVLIREQNNCIAVSLGPRVMRAETASIAMLACLQAGWGDWKHQKPRFSDDYL